MDEFDVTTVSSEINLCFSTINKYYNFVGTAPTITSQIYITLKCQRRKIKRILKVILRNETFLLENILVLNHS